MDDKPNPLKPKEEKPQEKPTPEKRVEKVITNSVKVKKKGELRKFMDVFIVEDISNIKNSIFLDVIVPAIRKTVYDVVVNSLNTILPGAGNAVKRDNPLSRISYNNSYDSPNQSVNRTNYNSYGAAESFSYDEIEFRTKADADEVLSTLDDIISQYGLVRISDLYEAVGVSCDHTYNNYGWTDIRSAEPIRTRDGWTIRFPRAIDLRRLK